MRLLPNDVADVDRLLTELVEIGVVLPYEIGGKRYGAVRNFRRWQRPKKPKQSYPQTPEVEAFVGTPHGSTDDGSEPVPHQSPTGGEKRPQRKDEGGRRDSEDKRSEENTSELQ